MRQSSVIFFFLFIAFLIFITQRGELPVYLGLLLMSPPTGSGAGGTVPTNVTITPLGQSSSASASSQVANYEISNATQALQVLG
jgi:hypothetical protein